MRYFGYRACLVALAVLGPAMAEAQTAPVRFPETGLPVLDCAPAAPAPTDSCLLRLPVGASFDGLSKTSLTDVEASFRQVREGRAGFPDGVETSATLLLVDLSPGLGGGRRPTFETERAILTDFIEAMPSGAEVAIYGFNEGLRRIADFTSNRSDLIAAVEELQLDGTNTRIASSVAEGVGVLAARDDVLLRNLVVVSDGQEEGGRSVAEVTGAAVDANVSISAIGAFWRPVGSVKTGRGMDYLEELTEATGGFAQQVILRQNAAAIGAAANFSVAYATALRNSMLILPEGEPAPATISLDLTVPEFSDLDQTVVRPIEVLFTPAQADEAPPAEPDPAEAPPEPEEEALLFGLPEMWIYVGGGLLVLLALLVALLIARRRGGPEEEALDPDALELEEEIEPDPPAAPVAPQAPARAWLVFTQDGRKAAIRDTRVNLGRSSSNEIVIADESVSRLHAQLHVNRDGGFSVTDMDSLNGTKVGGEPVKGTRQLRPGDVIQFGTVETKLVHA